MLLAVAMPLQVGARILFDDATVEAGIDDFGETWGSAIGDLNADGCPDIWIDHHQYTPTVILRNRCDGSGTFDQFDEQPDDSDGGQVIGPFLAETDTHGVAIGDLNNDGFADVLENSGSAWNNLVWVNDGLGRLKERNKKLGFVYQVDPRGLACRQPGTCNPVGRRGAMWFDYDQDGDLDVLLAARVNGTFYGEPTAVFEQTRTADGSPFFTHDLTTGLNYAGMYSCDDATMAELSGDDTLEVLCLGSASINAVLDTTKAPFRELTAAELGSTLFASGPADVAIGDFNGDLRNDIFSPLAAYTQMVVDQIDSRTLHYWHGLDEAPHAGYSFVAKGKVTIDFDWNIFPSKIFIGSGGYNPPWRSNLTVAGYRPHVRITLDASDPRNLGQPAYVPGVSAGIFIWFDGSRWQVRTSNIEDVMNYGGVGMVVQATAGVSGLGGIVGPVALGQPADKRPKLFIQNAAGQLDGRSGQIATSPSSCVSAAAADFDNDGDLDLMEVCSGRVKNLPNRIYENDGTGNFTSIPNAGADGALGYTGAAGQMPHGRGDAVLTADFDLDGRMDVFVTNGRYERPFSYAGQQQLIRNVSDSGNNWVQIDLEGVVSNRDAIGARVFASTPDGRVLLREQNNGMHRNAQNFKRIHFGLARNPSVDLEIRWPNGAVETHAGLAANRIYRCVEGGPCASTFAQDGDKVGVWRPSTGRFYLDADGSRTWTAGVDVVTDSFSPRTDLPVAGDWNGDGTEDLGAWRPKTGRFHLDADGSRTWTEGVDVKTDSFGIRSDVPVAGDWNGDGTDDIGVWRPSTGRFYLDADGSRTWTAGIDVITDPFGVPSDIPVAGDWNGDGTNDIGVWRPSTGRFYLDIDGSRTWTVGVDVITDPFGIPGDVPVAGDWSGDGTDDIGVWRPSTGRFYLDADGSHTWTSGIDAITESFGLATDLPIVGSW